MEEKNVASTYYLKVTILLLIGFISGFSARSFISEGTNIERIVANQKNETATSSTASVEKTKLFSVADQKAGLAVNVSDITLEKDTWIAIREDNGNGELGNILGASLFFNETKGSADVALVRTTEANKNYYAVLYIDDGDKVFDFKKDQPWKEENGDIFKLAFHVN